MQKLLIVWPYFSLMLLDLLRCLPRAHPYRWAEEPLKVLLICHVKFTYMYFWFRFTIFYNGIYSQTIIMSFVFLYVRLLQWISAKSISYFNCILPTDLCVERKMDGSSFVPVVPILKFAIWITNIQTEFDTVHLCMYVCMHVLLCYKVFLQWIFALNIYGTNLWICEQSKLHERCTPCYFRYSKYKGILITIQGTFICCILHTCYVATEIPIISINVLIDPKINNINPPDESVKSHSRAISFSSFIQIHGSHLLSPA